MEITTSLQRVNTHQLLSDLINENLGETSQQIEDVYNTFLSPLSDTLHYSVIQDANGLQEYHLDFEQFEVFGETPAKALLNLLHEMTNLISTYENGRP